MKQVSSVFGVAPKVRHESYIDRGQLDEELQRKLGRSTHIALRGESKCGKSWVRQKNIPDALVAQCRITSTTADIYTDILSQLGIKFIVEESSKDTLKGSIEGTAEAGFKLLAKLRLKLGLDTTEEEATKSVRVGQNINDLRFIADIIKESKKRIVIEDFHYLRQEQRTLLSYDLKTLWDYECYFVIIGVWTNTNLLINLNPELSTRIDEIAVYWSENELNSVIDKGCACLKIKFGSKVKALLVNNSYGNVGILQQLTLEYLDESRIYTEQSSEVTTDDENAFSSAAMRFAEQLNTRFQTFAKDISSGIRKRSDSTGIYAHAMAVIIAAEDVNLINGLHLDEIYSISNRRQPRIQKQNLKTVLQKIEELQIDSEGRGLVLSYNTSSDEVSATDRTLLFYRKYSTLSWPWEDLIKEAAESEPKIILN